MAHIVILGAGYGGIRAARKLSKLAPSDTRIDLIDQNSYHVEKTGLHQVATGTAAADSISYDIETNISDKINFIRATVKKIDFDKKNVEFEDHDDISYDYVIVALGFESETFGIPGVEENSVGFSDVDSAQIVYNRIKENVANYSTSQNKDDLNIVVCGAGFTGVEVLGELVDTANMLKKKYNVPEINITCLEAADRILPMFTDKSVDYTLKFFKKNNINLITGAKISKLEKNKVNYTMNDEEKSITASSIIWTVGVSGSHVIKDSNLNAKRNRVTVTKYLNIEEHPEAYFIGDDAASFNPDETGGRPYGTTAQLALEHATTAAKNIVAQIKGNEQEVFKYNSMGTIASLSQHDGVAEVGPDGKIHVKGYMAVLFKHGSVDKSLFETAGTKMVFQKGVFF